MRKSNSRALTKVKHAHSAQSKQQVNEKVNAEDESLLRKGLGRRAFIRIALAGGITGAILAHAADIFAILDHFAHRAEVERATRLDELQTLFGLGGARSGSLVPAANHPFKPPPAGSPCYPMEGKGCEAYLNRFYPGVNLQSVSGYPQIRPDDSIVLFGSQVSNLGTRKLMGNPWDPEPRFQIVGERADWRAQLIWNLHTPTDAPLTEREQYGTEWITANHIISARHGDEFSPRLESTRITEDYLLVTALPRFSTGQQRVIVFSGIHGPGTLAAAKLLEAPPMEELFKILRKTERDPYYQALFHVDLLESDEGELLPRTITLVDARKIVVEYGRAFVSPDEQLIKA